MTIRNGLLASIIKPTGTIAGLEGEQVAAGSATLAYIAGLEANCGFNESVAQLQTIDTDVAALQSLTRIQSRITDMSARIEAINVDGMSKREAQWLADSVDAIHEDIGTNDVIVLAGLESFGNSITAAAYTEAALKSGDNALKKVWGWIMEMLKKLKDIIATWWAKFFGDVERMVKYADKVKGAVSSYKDEKDNKKVSAKQGVLSKAAEKPTATSIVSGIKDLKASVSGWLTTHVGNCEAACDGVSSVMEAAGGSDTALAAAYAKLGSTADAFIAGAGIPATGSQLGGKFVEVDVQDTKTAAADTTENRKKMYDAITKTAYKVKSGTAADKDVEIDRLGKDDVETVAESVKDMGTEILELRKSRTDARKYADDIEKAAKAVQKESEGLDVADKANKGELVSMAKAGINTLTELTSGAVSAWVANCVRVGFAALKVAEKSI